MKRFLACLMLSLNAGAAFAEGEAVQPIDYKKLGMGLTIQYEMDETTTAERKKILDEMSERFRDLNKPKDLRDFFKAEKKIEIPELTVFDKVKAIGSMMEVLSSYRHSKGLKYSTEQALNDLEFFLNVDGKANKTFFKEVDRTATHFGKFVLASMIANPETELEALEARREF